MNTVEKEIDKEYRLFKTTKLAKMVLDVAPELSDRLTILALPIDIFYQFWVK